MGLFCPLNLIISWKPDIIPTVKRAGGSIQFIFRKSFLKIRKKMF